MSLFATRKTKLLQWAGVIQKNATKFLLAKGEFCDQPMNQLIPYCFPTEEPISGPLTYVFRFRSSQEVFYNVFCLLDQTSFQLRDLDTNQQCCICIVTELYHFDLYDEALKIARSLLLHSVSSAEHFFEALYNNPTSITGMTTIQKMLANALTREMCITQMIKPLTTRFSLQEIGDFILNLLCDTPFLITSSDMMDLSQFCYSLFAVIDPLEWRHAFVPILPVNVLDMVQSPAPFIIGVHRSLIPNICAEEMEAHIFIDLDTGVIEHVNTLAMPFWATQISSSLKDATVKSMHQLTLKLICSALGIHPSSSQTTTARRIVSAAKSTKFEPGSAVFQLVNSRTSRCLLDALKEQPIQTQFSAFLASSINCGITSPASQDVDEFPLKKNQVLRSRSVQFHKDKRFHTRSTSIPNIQGEVKQSQSMLLPKNEE